MEEKFNLTVIDKNPEIKNFVYPGVPKSWVDKAKHDFKHESPVLEFIYDEGEVLISTSEIHTLVVSSYVSIEEMENPIPEEETS